MLGLLKKLFSTRDGSQTVVVMNDDGTKPSRSYRMNPVSLWLFSVGVICLVIISVVVLIRFTPVGGLVYNQQKMRNSVIAIQQKVAALQDTIEGRSMQLHQMKEVIAKGGDSSFKASASPLSRGHQSKPAPYDKPASSPAGQSIRGGAANPILVHNLFSGAPDFPAPYPIEGSLTRKFNIKNGHFGLDIAATAGDPFKAIGDGVVLNEQWTFNYGYVIIVQHAGGLISIYKHAQSLAKAIGESVRRGDILGTIGNVGILSSGPHLHIEIWQQGIPQNPEHYLINQ